MSDPFSPPPAGEPADDQFATLVRMTTVVYALQAASFVVGISLVAALIINYVKRDDVQGTWLVSHFRWQIRTFWFTLLWGFLGGLTWILVIGHFILIAAGIWLVYRIVKGWVFLSERKPMYR